MADSIDYNALASLVSLSEAYVTGLPEKPCAVAPREVPSQIPAAAQTSATQESAAAQDSAPVQEEQRAPLDAVAAKISSCTRCGLCNGRTNTVPGMGPAHPVVMVIGEGPGHDEDMQGLPFVGAAGQLLDKMLAAIKLSRETNCFIANIVKCRPPNNRDPLPEEAAACRSFLDAQISTLKPKMILLVGRIALQNLLDTKIGITRIHGQFFEYNGIPVMPTYHPSALLRAPELKRDAWNDLKGFRAKLEEITGESFTVPTGGN
ncbi:MAG: uracil-DNA glycosylase [Treponema sp.]|nr:uracil-DNA glycosylase [Candidatus Treponema caballi]